MKKTFRLVLAVVLVFTMIFTQAVVSFAEKSSKAPAVEKIMKKITDDTNNNKVKDVLEDEMAVAKDTDKLPVIVMFNQDVTEQDLATIKGSTGDFEVTNSFKIIPGLSAKLTKSQIDKLSKSGLVKQVEYDMPVYATLNTAKDSFGVAKAVADFGVTGDRDGAATTYSTTDVVVAVIDTGIDAAHVDLDGGKVIAWKDFVNSRTTPYDDNGHGSHCSGIIAGTGEGSSSYKGVATGASLIGLKVLDSAGSGSMSNVTAAIDWCRTNKATYNIKVLSLSLGTSGSSDGTDSTSVAINNANSAGLICCVAAGNAGPGKATIGSPGAASGAFTVAAMGDTGENGFFLAYFSSRGLTADGRMKPDIGAPGYNIMSVKAGSTNGYVSMSGTSMATPFVAGVCALMLDANNSLTPAQIKSYITSTAIDFGPAGQDLDFGYGRLDAYAAIKAAGGYSGTGPAVPAHVYKADSLAGTGKYDTFTFSVSSTTFPIAVTAILGGTQDFDCYLLNPSGTQVAAAEGTTRQETISYKPTVTGTYTLKVLSYSGSGSYTIDVSDASALTQTANQ